MKLTEEIKDFIRIHTHADATALLLSAAKYPGIDVPFAVEQLLCRRQLKDKLPSWYEHEALVYPSRMAAEQCSSECTAMYKQRLISTETTLCDLTGGMGVDSYFFSRKAHSVMYIERFSAYCEAAQHNFAVLQAHTIQVIAADVMECLDTLPAVDVFYIDPARRAEGNKRVFALQDCEPDLLQIKSRLLAAASCVIAKISPMADIRHTLSLLPETKEVHVLSVKNECKELLFVMQNGQTLLGDEAPSIYCVNFTTTGFEQSFRFTVAEEQGALPAIASEVETYLYEPNASILKAGAFKSVSVQLGLRKLHVSSHLYTSNEWRADFPGRTFRVKEVIKFGGKASNGLGRAIPRANITTRNFPLSVEELRKRTKIADGGDVYLFATTLATNEKVLINCSKV